MRRSIAFSAVLLLVVMSFFFLFFLGGQIHLGTPEELKGRIEEKLAGEPFDYSDGDPLKRTFHTIDRDIEFTAYWDDTAEDSYGRQYLQSSQFKSNYDAMVHEYWAEELDSKLNECGFDEAINYRVDDRYASTGKIYFYDYKSISIFIDRDATAEQIEKVNEFLVFLKELCTREDEFHSGKYEMKYCVSINWIDPGSDEYTSASDQLNITSDTSDDIIDVRLYGKKLDGRPISISHHATFGCYIRITGNQPK